MGLKLPGGTRLEVCLKKMRGAILTSRTTANRLLPRQAINNAVRRSGVVPDLQRDGLGSAGMLVRSTLG
jgi:hypothetical protein